MVNRHEDLLDQVLNEIHTKCEGDRQQRGRQAKPQGAIANSAQDVESQPYEAGEDSHALKMTNLMAHLHVHRAPFQLSDRFESHGHRVAPCRDPGSIWTPMICRREPSLQRGRATGVVRPIVPEIIPTFKCISATVSDARAFISF